MSAFDITGAIIWSILAFLFFNAAFQPNKETGRYGSEEAGQFMVALICLSCSVFSIARMFGAHL